VLATTIPPAGVRNRPITAARGSSFTMIIFRGVRRYSGTGRRDSWQSENLPGIGGIAREQGDPVRRHPGQVILRCRHPGSSGRARECGGESVGYCTHGLCGNGGQVGKMGAWLVPIDLL
jgi:hypothetical protein